MVTKTLMVVSVGGNGPKHGWH